MVERILFHKIGVEFYGEKYVSYLEKSVETGVRDMKYEQKIIREFKRRIQNPKILLAIFSDLDREALKMFQLFGFSEEICNELSSILSVKNFRKDWDGRRMIQELLDCLNLDNLKFIEHKYVSRKKHLFDVIAYGRQYAKRF